MTSLTILGSTGSIGEQTLDVVRQHPQSLQVHALSSYRNLDKLEKQIEEFSPSVVVTEKKAPFASDYPEINFLVGEEGLVEIASSSKVDLVVSAIVGIAGLRPTEAAIRAGKKVALANKESMVVAGHLLSSLASASSATIIPIDSEHNGIFRLLLGHPRETVSSITLLASGGPFLRRELNTFQSITPEEAVKHPHWPMGKKISVDSATLMNKGLELIEARWLFNVPPDRIHALIHPQCLMHAMVEFSDGQYHAILAHPDMHEPIRFALFWPERVKSPTAKPLSFTDLPPLTFESPDLSRFPALKLAQSVMESASPGSAVILNAANEEAVAAFLQKNLRFDQIPQVIELSLEKLPSVTPTRIEEILTIDQETRIVCQHIMKALQHS